VPTLDADPVDIPTSLPPVLPSGVAPTPDRPRFSAGLLADSGGEHSVAAGENLSAIALRYGTTVQTLVELNALTNPDILSVGQVIRLPDAPDALTPDLKLLPDSLLVRGGLSRGFDTRAFVSDQPGFIRTASDSVTMRQADGASINETLTSAEVIERVSQEYGVDPRVLLTALEYRAGWLSRNEIDEALETHPLIAREASPVERTGLYRQLAWFANEVNRGYYGWKYEAWDVIELSDGTRMRYALGLNAATVGLQHVLRLNNTLDSWQRDISLEGFVSVYRRYFGEPFQAVPDVYVSFVPEQPQMTLPFRQGETWFFTGGAHGGWGSGSAWSSVDFAPPDERTDRLCYLSAFPVVAVAAGVIARSDAGVVVLDLDGDGDELTGWTVFYLHLANRINAGVQVQPGDVVGYASCEGGVSTATHLHIGRRYNGEWVPATCFACPDGVTIPPFRMAGWEVVALRGQEYQGYLQNSGERRVAEQGRLTPINRVSW
jgi:murein DD-endopeptidase MepM/ murein hydrolase activator NlpD